MSAALSGAAEELGEELGATAQPPADDESPASTDITVDPNGYWIVGAEVEAGRYSAVAADSEYPMCVVNVLDADDWALQFEYVESGTLLVDVTPEADRVSFEGCSEITRVG